ncbi:hypothetical protein BGW36DRAFT_369136 [Talaromyces proteolyticus]|uniref:Secreted protein n=1 Tax=Talaromyces proteolyticus TaxID=1131652 RepID=A0AAD4KZ68_9EURO|nr:uncharacterized protein BGW36DRAFT_369136 [Talaromyces proteolyticus]KAH8703313.1 hypothetical protein BGW36DRAFT_369136 [Talaromyces proteolyticus]
MTAKFVVLILLALPSLSSQLKKVSCLTKSPIGALWLPIIPCRSYVNESGLSAYHSATFSPQAYLFNITRISLWVLSIG